MNKINFPGHLYSYRPSLVWIIIQFLAAQLWRGVGRETLELSFLPWQQNPQRRFYPQLVAALWAAGQILG